MGINLEKFTKIYGKNWVIGRKLIPLIKEIGRKAQGIVADVGCGDAPFQPYFSAAEKYLKLDREAKSEDTIHTVLPEIPLDTASVDTMLLFHVVTDIPDLPVLFRDVYRVLKPGGRAYVLESFCYPPHDLPYDYYRLLPNGLQYHAEQCGLSVTNVTHLGGYFARAAMMRNAFLFGMLKRFPVLGLLGTFGIIVTNLTCRVLDRILYRPRLAPSYLAEITKHTAEGEQA